MAQVNIRIDDGLKEKANILFEVTTKIDPFYSESNSEFSERPYKEADEGKLTEYKLITDDGTEKVPLFIS